MKNVKRLFSAIFIIISVLGICPFTIINSYAAENLHVEQEVNADNSLFIDSYGMFDMDEENELNNAVREYSDKLNMNIFIFLAGPDNAMSESKTQEFVEKMYEEYYGAYTDGLMYFMDFTGNKPAYDYISLSGNAVLQYTERLDELFSRMNGYLPPSTVTDYGNYKNSIKSGIYSFLEHLVEISERSPLSFYEDKANHEYYYYKGGKLVISTSMPLKKRMTPLIFAIPMGIIVAMMYYFAMKKTYKFKASASPNVYLQSENTEFIRREDRFIRAYTTSHVRESSNSSGSSNSSSSSGGGSGHGSSGGSHR